MTNSFITATALTASLLLAACGPTDNEENNVSADWQNDPYIWLEDVQGKKALNWVNAQNEVSLARLETDPRFEALKIDAEKVLTATDRIP
ncbi:MAG: S9 family peptidase, partial [Sphingomonadales bacterium]|nr:S9 family peptidase [Sphingomonadales bacterium]